MIEKKKRTQMAFDIQPEIHTQVKVLAAIRNISVSLWVTRAIKDRIVKETKYDKNT
jgi:predicted HicB family RNase H-like nuclease